MTRLAHHAEEAAEPGAIGRYAPQAAALAAARGAHRGAAAHLAAALRYADRLAPDIRADLYSRLAHESALIGEVDEALAAYDAAVQCCRLSGDRRMEGELLARRAGPLVLAGRQHEAVDTIQASLDVLEPLGPGPELAFAYGRLCSAHMLARELSVAVEWGERAIALSERLGRTDHLCFALIESGVALLMSGNDSGLTRVRRAIDLARRDGMHDRVAAGLSQIGSGAGARSAATTWPCPRCGSAWTGPVSMS